MLRPPLSQTPHTQRNSTATISSSRRALHEGTSDDGTTNKRVCIFVLGDSEGEREERESEREKHESRCVYTYCCVSCCVLRDNDVPHDVYDFLECCPILFFTVSNLRFSTEAIFAGVRVFAQFDEVPLPHMGSHWCACGLSSASKSGRVCP